MWTVIFLLVILVAGALVVSRMLRNTPFEGRPLGCGCGDGLWRGKDKALKALENNTKNQ